MSFVQLPEDTTLDEVKQLDREGHLHRNLTHAVAKDTVSVPDGGYVILRIKADNPGRICGILLSLICT